MANISQTQPKDLGKISGGPALNLKDEENSNTNQKRHLGPWLNPGSTGWVYSTSQERI